ncbi:MAG: hypothetical protein JW728_05505 [Candidatus Aureabacteria bacterium]|nr:hypothetical protein [Candidatus Auribacterota bacterium]
MKKNITGILVAMSFVFLSAPGAYAVVDVFTDSVSDQGRYSYVYPQEGSSIELTNEEKHSGVNSLKISLNTEGFAGAAAGKYPPFNLQYGKDNAVLEFWVKGEKGGEVFEVLFLDSDRTDGTKTETGVVVVPKYLNVTTQWQKVQIPLAAFSDNGQYWDSSQNVPDSVDWNEIQEVKFAIRPYDENDSFTVYVDDIKIVNP